MFGSEYVKYSIIIIPLVFQFLLGVINNFLGIQILVASGNQKKYSKSLLIGCIAIVLLNIVLGNFFEIYGIAVAATISELVLTIVLIRNFRKIK